MLRWSLFLIILIAWVGPGQTIPSDLNKDGVVDFADFFLFADQFGKEGPPERPDTVVQVRRDTIAVVQHDTLVINDTLTIVHNDTIIQVRVDTVLQDSLVVVETRLRQEDGEFSLIDIVTYRYAAADTIHIRGASIIVERDTIEIVVRDTVQIVERDTVEIAIRDTVQIVERDTVEIAIRDTVQISPTEREGIAFSYTFDNSDEISSNWTKDSHGSWRISDSALHIIGDDPNFLMRVGAPIYFTEDVDISVETEWVGGIANQKYGIQFRNNRDRGAYCFGISANGSPAVWEWDESGANYLLNIPFAPTINRNGKNTLRIVTRGTLFSFYINGEKIPIEISDASSLEGRIQLFVTDRQEVKFDNLLIRTDLGHVTEREVVIRDTIEVDRRVDVVIRDTIFVDRNVEREVVIRDTINTASIFAFSVESLQETWELKVIQKYNNSLLFSAESPPVFLGKITTSTFDSQSIFDEFGTYGSPFRSNSIWNEFGSYGSRFASYSPWNKFSSSSPFIVKNDVVIGRLAANEFVAGAFHPKWLIPIFVDD